MSSVAVERALILLRYMIEHEDGLSIREVSREMGYSPATVQKIVNALNAQGYVIQDELTERYHLGPEAIKLGLTAMARLDIHQVARPHLLALSVKSGETTFLGISRGDYAVYVDKVVSEQPIRMDAPLGIDRPYNCTAVGKILLSGMEPEEVERLASGGCFEQRTGNTILEVSDLKPELEEIREQGWAMDGEEFTEGVRCIAAPIFNHEGTIVAALTISGPADRIQGKFEELISMLRIEAAEISSEMGASNKAVRRG